jgi:hypothetical protein
VFSFGPCDIQLCSVLANHHDLADSVDTQRVGILTQSKILI